MWTPNDTLQLFHSPEFQQPTLVGAVTNLSSDQPWMYGDFTLEPASPDEYRDYIRRIADKSVLEVMDVWEEQGFGGFASGWHLVLASGEQHGINMMLFDAEARRAMWRWSN